MNYFSIKISIVRNITRAVNSNMAQIFPVHRRRIAHDGQHLLDGGKHSKAFTIQHAPRHWDFTKILLNCLLAFHRIYLSEIIWKNSRNPISLIFQVIPHNSINRIADNKLLSLHYHLSGSSLS